MKFEFEYPYAWTAKISGVGRVPAMWEDEMVGDDMVVNWVPTTKMQLTKSRQRIDAIVGQLGAGNPDRKIHVLMGERVGDSFQASDVSLFTFGHARIEEKTDRVSIVLNGRTVLQRL